MNDSTILEIDAGNSAFKWRLVSPSGVISRGRGAHLDLEMCLVSILNENQQIVRARVVSVASQVFGDQLEKILEQGNIPVQFASIDSSIAAVKCAYSDTSQLGVDRWLAVVAAVDRYSKPLVVADMGSALTIDFIDSKNTHLGGYILPGWSLMREALVEGTQIPDFRNPQEYDAGRLRPGQSTSEAIGMGRLLSLSASVDSAVWGFESSQDEKAVLVCTGGDASKIIPHLRSESVYCSDLVLDGLSLVLG